MTGRTRAAIAAAVALALALPPTARAAVTIGSDLSGQPVSPSANGTWVNSALEAGRRASGGLHSPVDGVITRWRIKVGEKTAPIALRVIDPLGGGLYTGAGSSDLVTPAVNVTSTFPTQLHISRGDLLGTETAGGLVSQFDTDASPNYTLLLFWFAPPLADGGPPSSPNLEAGGYVNLINADIEPTSRFRIKRVKRLAGGRLWIAAKLPNEGTLRIDDLKLAVPAPGWRIVVVRPHGATMRLSFIPLDGSRFTRLLRPTAPAPAAD
ncbi:MAG: hypothetical protein ACJ75Z_12210 [Solirubrobacterales bacterium]